MWFDTNELEAFPKAPKAKPAEVKRDLAMAEAQFEANVEDREWSAEDIIALAMQIIILIIRRFVLR
jgi:hypothetical protein